MASPTDEPPDIMNSPAFDPPTPPPAPRRRSTITSQASTTGTLTPDTCRICRSEGTASEPLFHPCKCSGSIKFVHQECLIEWLSHSHKKHCELCKTPFRFTKLYDAHMPLTLPLGVFAKRAAWHVVKGFGRVSRLALVGLVWFGLIPWIVRWVWRWLFWLADAAWSRETFLEMMKQESERPESGSGLDWVSKTFQQFFAPMNESTIELGAQQPFMMSLAQSIGLIDGNGSSNSMTWLPDEPSMLSDWSYLSTLTDSRRMNRFILDVFEGQLITCVILTSFILVFLLREWVVQQQPLVNLEGMGNVQNQLREAAERMQAENERLRRQQELLDQARRRLVELQNEADALPTSETHEDLPAFEGWDSLEKLIDDTTQHLRQEGELEHDLFLTGAASVTNQIRAAGQAGENLGGFTNKVYEKFASYPDPERREWEGVLVSEIEANAAKRRSHASAEDSNAAEGSSADAAERPPMPSRDFSSRATHIQRLLQESDGVFPPGEGPGAERRRKRRAASSSGHGADVTPRSASSDADIWEEGTPPEMTSRSSEAAIAGAPSLQRSRSRGSYPPRSSSRFGTIPVANAGVDARINIRRSVFVNDSGEKVQPAQPRIEERMLAEDELKKNLEAEVAKELEEEREGSNGESASTEGGPSQEEAAQNDNSFHAEVPDPPPPARRDEERHDSESFGTRVASAFREEFGLDEVEDIENLRQMGLDADDEAALHEDNLEAADPGRAGDPEATMAERLLDWFWGDIRPPSEQEPVPPVREELQHAADDERHEGEQGQEAPFVPVQNGQPQAPQHPQPQPHPHGDDQEEDHDPEVVAAAQQAGLDADAIEDAEDLEGIFELIGVQGPLIGLFQTSAFCMLLVACTIAGAVFAPYVWGKVCLSLLADPVYFLLVMPLQIASFITDVAIDSCLMLGGWAVMVFALSMDWLLGAVKAIFPAPATGKLWEQLVQFSGTAASKAGGRLASVVVQSAGSGGEEWNWAFLAASVHAHASLQAIQEEIRSVLDFTGHAITAIVDAMSSGTVLKNVAFAAKSVPSLTIELLRAAKALPQVVQPIVAFLTDLSRGRLHFTTPSVSLDPSLVFWSSSDRASAIFTGYAALATLAAIYVAIDTPLTSSAVGRKREKQVRDSLRQAGGVLKVILIISIEMLVFPLYCGLLLDLAFVPLFQDVSVSSRWHYATHRPWSFGFVHWFVGTCYMFHFALFVGMCRKILRKGVLWFIRDPDDPNFHPVRDVLEKNVVTQLRKIAFSALVYGALVILCLGGVIWSIGKLFHGIFPIHWTSTEPVLEFPMDLLLYNFATPLVIRLFRPSEVVQAMYTWWLRRCARVLQLSHFLFDDRKKDEERSGTYVLTPCNDSYRPPKPGEAFLHADSTDVYIADKDGKRNEHFAKVFVPCYFRVRIALFMMCLWAFSAFLGLCGTLVPLVFGRAAFRAMVGEKRLWVNDIYAYLLGAYVLGGATFLALNCSKAAAFAKEKVGTVEFKAAIDRARKVTARAFRCAYVYGFIGVVLPILMALLLHCYIVLPLATWSDNSALSHNDTPADNTADDPSATESGSSMHTLADHSLHLLQEHALGILYVRILGRLVLSAPTSRAAEAFRRITAHGYTNPDPRLATRYFIVPCLIIGTTLLVGPPLTAQVALAMYTFGDGGDVRAKAFRYSYAAFAALGLAVWGVRALGKATARWRARIRDEVYLVGERLHNFGETKPPVGSKSVSVRRGSR